MDIVHSSLEVVFWMMTEGHQQEPRGKHPNLPNHHVDKAANQPRKPKTRFIADQSAR
jgi:hypothetical protein